MQQVLHHLGTGVLELASVPCPASRPGHLLIETRQSVISAGTERMLLDFGRAGWLERARQQPDRVRQVLDKVRTDGLAAAWDAVQSKLDRLIPLGYANCGRVLSVGAGVRGWRPGDRVLSNGPHAEMVLVPANLCARVPAAVSDEEAPFAVLAAIALQGLRLAAPTLGESFVVTGLGLVGLLAAQLLRAHGCRVLGIDRDAGRLALATRWGVTPCELAPGADPAGFALDWTRGRGVDGVIIAAATTSNEPALQAAEMCRRRGRIVLTGVAGLELSRDLLYKKELSFQVSCSYGPGRYDAAYERDGQDYPYGDVRWTAQRNMEAALEAMADRRLEVGPLISHRFAFEEIERAYRTLTGPERSLALVLTYPASDGRPPAPARRVERPAAAPGGPRRRVSISVIGAGEFASRVLLPLLREGGAELDTVVSENGVNAAGAARRFGFACASSDASDAARAQAVVIATRHDSHARLAVEALEAGQAVWVEKPLVSTEAELRELSRVCARRVEADEPVSLMVGFNRRFSPFSTRLARALGRAGGAFEFRYLVNAGRVDEAHWTMDSRQGGGRILGECCHFIDLLRYLAASPIATLEARPAGPQGVRLWLTFENGSAGSIDYLTGGARSFPKERLEVFGAGRVWVLDNFRDLAEHPAPLLGRFRPWRGAVQKGHREAIRAFLDAVETGGPPPIPLDEVFEVARWSLVASELVR